MGQNFKAGPARSVNCRPGPFTSSIARHGLERPVDIWARSGPFISSIAKHGLERHVDIWARSGPFTASYTDVQF